MSVNVQKQTQLTAHKWQVSCLEFSPNGLYLASGSWDKSAIIWDLRTLEPFLILRRHTQPITCLSWQPQSRKSDLGLLATGSSDNTVALWNPESGHLVSNLCHHTSWVLGTSFSNDGALLATASWDKIVTVCSIPTGKPVNTLVGHTTGVWTCAFNPEVSSIGNTLCSGAEDGSLKLWDIRTNSVAMSLVGGHDDRIKSCSWSPNGQYIASSSADGKVALWEPRSGTALTKIKAHEETTNCVKFYPFVTNNAVPLLFSAGGRTCKVWHPFRKQHKQLLSLKPHKFGEEVDTIGISPDGTLLATGGSDTDIVLSSVDISLTEVDALPVDNVEKNVNRGTQLWKKYTRKVIENTMNKEADTLTPTSEREDPESHNSALLVGRAVHRSEKHRVEKERTINYNGEKLSAEPEVMLQERIRNLRSGGEKVNEPLLDSTANQHWPSKKETPPPQPVHNELLEARQHLRKVLKTSSGSSASGTQDNGAVYDVPNPHVNGWEGVTSDSQPTGYSHGYPVNQHSPDNGITITVDNENGDTTNSYFKNGNVTNGMSDASRYDKSVRIQQSNRHQPFIISGGGGKRTSNGSNGSSSSGTLSTVTNNMDDESGSISSSNYYADIDDIAQEMIELTRQVEDHRF